MRFSWRALLLAPLAVPVVTGAVLALAVDQQRLTAFFMFGAFTAVFSYGATVGLLLPVLWIVTRWARLTPVLAGILGVLLGAALCGPVSWVMYGSSGDDSGPPTESYFSYMARMGVAWCWPFIVGGGVNGALYAWLARPGRPIQSTTESTDAHG